MLQADSLQNPRGVLCWEVVIWLHSPQGLTWDTGQLAGSKSTQSLAQRKEPSPLLPDFSSAFSCPTPAPAQDRSQLAPALGWAVVLWEGQTEKLSGCPVPGGTVAPCGEVAHPVGRLHPLGLARQSHFTGLQAAVLFGCPKAGAIVG